MKKMIGVYIFVLFVFAFIFPKHNVLLSADKQRENDNAIIILKKVMLLDNWRGIHDAYVKYTGYDDGGIAEAYSEVITTLLAQKWNSIKELENISKKDKSFFEFVLHHIDATADTDKLRIIISNAKGKRLVSDEKICIRIKVAAEEALKSGLTKSGPRRGQ